MGDRTLRAALRYLSQFNAFRTVIFVHALLIVIEQHQCLGPKGLACIVPKADWLCSIQT